MHKTKYEVIRSYRFLAIVRSRQRCTCQRFYIHFYLPKILPTDYLLPVQAAGANSRTWLGRMRHWLIQDGRLQGVRIGRLLDWLLGETQSCSLGPLAHRCCQGLIGTIRVHCMCPVGDLRTCMGRSYTPLSQSACRRG